MRERLSKYDLDSIETFSLGWKSKRPFRTFEKSFDMLSEQDQEGISHAFLYESDDDGLNKNSGGLHAFNLPTLAPSIFEKFPNIMLSAEPSPVKPTPYEEGQGAIDWAKHYMLHTEA
mgnify:CR=1 FL=1